MKTQRTYSKALALFALIGIVLGSVAIWNATGVKAFTAIEKVAFGAVSLSPLQTLRLNVTNLFPSGPARPGSNRSSQKVTLGFNTYARSERGLTSSQTTGVPLGSCVNTYQFLSNQSCDVTLGPGESASFDYVAPADSGGLSQVVPAVQDDQGNGSAGLIYTLELREGGVTTFVMNPGVVISAGGGGGAGMPVGR